MTLICSFVLGKKMFTTQTMSNAHPLINTGSYNL